jgi:hypothetical protein
MPVTLTTFDIGGRRRGADAVGFGFTRRPEGPAMSDDIWISASR